MKSVMSVLDKASQLQARNRERQQRELMEQLTLPFWPDDKRGVPNGLLRTALFAALDKRRSSKDRRYYKREPMPSVSNVSIIYTGIQLDQDHLSVWECLIHIGRMQQLGDRCYCTPYQVLKMLGKEDTGNYRAWLLRIMSELQANSVEITQDGFSYSGSLIMEFIRDESSNTIVIFSPKIIALYQPSQFSHIHWAIRLALNSFPLAQWLHGFYSTHRDPLPYKAETIHRLCGSTAKSVRNFKSTSLKNNLEAMQAACKEHGQFCQYAISGDMVHVSFNPAKALPAPAPTGTGSTRPRNRINATPEQDQRTTGTGSKRYRNRINGTTGTGSTPVPEQDQQAMKF